MQIPISVSREDVRPLQTQIFDRIREMILDGRLRPGIRLPSTRALSAQLDVSRNTVIIAYERLIAEGYLSTRAASRTYVSDIVPDRAIRIDRLPACGTSTDNQSRSGATIPFNGRAQRIHPLRANRPPIDFWVGCPHPRAFPKRAWQKLLLRNLLTAGSNMTEYGDPAGLHLLRDAIADHLSTARGIRATPDQVIVVHGVQEALNVAARLFLTPGAGVLIEDPAYQGAAYLFESYGARLNAVAVDEHGVTTAGLPKDGVRLAYVTPSHQFPTGWTMSQQRRIELLDWAARCGAYIFEDDYDSDFRYDGPPLNALCGLDRDERVIYTGTFSKSLGAGLRTGYMVVPGHLVRQATTVKALLSNGQSWLEQATLADLLRSGTFERHLRVIRQRYLEARNALIEALRSAFGNVKLSGQDGGMHLMWHLPDGFPDAETISRAARSVGVGLYGIEGAGACALECERIRERTLTIGYAGLSPSLIGEGVERVAKALSGLRT